MDRRSLVRHGVVVGGLMLVSLVAWWNVWVAGSPVHSITSQGGDVAQELWFLAWLPYAALHGHNPFFSNSLWAGGGGFNVLANPSDLLPSAVLAPVTTGFGPIAALNVGALLSPVISGWCMFCLLRKVSTSFVGQLAGTVFWAFSPFMIYNLPYGHLDLTLLYFPPLFVLLVLQLVTDTRYSARRIGICAGLLVVAQFFTGVEVLAITLITVGMGLVIAGAVWWRRLLTMARRVAEAVAWSLAIVVLVLGFPVWFMVDGPRHVQSPLWHDAALPMSWIISAPGAHDLSALQGLVGYFGPVGPSQEFVGVLLLVFLGVSMLVMWRLAMAWLALAVGAISWLLTVSTPSTPLKADPLFLSWLAWRIFEHVPEARDIGVSRISFVIDGAIAILLALAIESWSAWGRSALARRGPGRVGADRSTWVKQLWPLLVALVAAVAVLPTASTYSWPFTTSRAGAAPSWFSHGALDVPPGTRLLVLPLSEQTANAQPLAWQAEDKLHFDLTGGYVAVPGGDGVHATWYSPLGGAVGLLSEFPTTTRWTAPQVERVRAQIRRWRVGVVVATYPTTATALADMTKVVGRSPVHREGAWVWSVHAGRR